MNKTNDKKMDNPSRTGSGDIIHRLLDLLLVMHRRETGLRNVFDFLIVKNSMIYVNVMANMAGIAVMRLVVKKSGFKPEDYGLGLISPTWHMLLLGVIFILALTLTVIYESPIRRCLRDMYRRETGPEDLLERARRRVLNEPYYLISLDLGMWLLSGLVLSIVFYFQDGPRYLIIIPFFSGLNTGLIITTMVFFMSEHIVQHHMVPYFFPEGGVTKVSGVIRTHIITRLAILFMAINIIPFLAQIQLVNMMGHTHPELAVIAEPVRSAVIMNAVVFILAGLVITIQVGINMSIPFHDIIRVLEAVRRGRFDQKVQVTSNDEIGYTGDVINDMTEDLKDRERLRKSLFLAREVQQNLLPQCPPLVEGLDIAGRAIFCDETGGDFFDFLDMSSRGSGKLGLVVADVSDHGLQAALLMVSVRAYLRHHAYHNEPLSDIMADVNSHLCQDVKDSGHFITLFLCELDQKEKRIHWIRAGHDPALLYNRHTGRFKELVGKGAPLGVSRRAEFEEGTLPIVPGQILVMMTDGVWEARNPQGLQFGKDRLKNIIQSRSDARAEEIIQAVVDELEDFTGAPDQGDDVTLLVVKVEA